MARAVRLTQEQYAELVETGVVKISDNEYVIRNSVEGTMFCREVLDPWSAGAYCEKVIITRG